MHFLVKIKMNNLHMPWYWMGLLCYAMPGQYYWVDAEQNQYIIFSGKGFPDQISFEEIPNFIQTHPNLSHCTGVECLSAGIIQAIPRGAVPLCQVLYEQGVVGMQTVESKRCENAQIVYPMMKARYHRLAERFNKHLSQGRSPFDGEILYLLEQTGAHLFRLSNTVKSNNDILSNTGNHNSTDIGILSDIGRASSYISRALLETQEQTEPEYEEKMGGAQIVTFSPKVSTNSEEMEKASQQFLQALREHLTPDVLIETISNKQNSVRFIFPNYPLHGEIEKMIFHENILTELYVLALDGSYQITWSETRCLSNEERDAFLKEGKQETAAATSASTTTLNIRTLHGGVRNADVYHEQYDEMQEQVDDAIEEKIANVSDEAGEYFLVKISMADGDVSIPWYWMGLLSYALPGQYYGVNTANEPYIIFSGKGFPENITLQEIPNFIQTHPNIASCIGVGCLSAEAVQVIPDDAQPLYQAVYQRGWRAVQRSNDSGIRFVCTVMQERYRRLAERFQMHLSRGKLPFDGCLLYLLEQTASHLYRLSNTTSNERGRSTAYIAYALLGTKLSAAPKQEGKGTAQIVTFSQKLPECPEEMEAALKEFLQELRTNLTHDVSVQRVPNKPNTVRLIFPNYPLHGEMEKMIFNENVLTALYKLALDGSYEVTWSETRHLSVEERAVILKENKQETAEEYAAMSHTTINIQTVHGGLRNAHVYHEQVSEPEPKEKNTSAKDIIIALGALGTAIGSVVTAVIAASEDDSGEKIGNAIASITSGVCSIGLFALSIKNYRARRGVQQNESAQHLLGNSNNH